MIVGAILLTGSLTTSGDRPPEWALAPVLQCLDQLPSSAAAATTPEAVTAVYRAGLQACATERRAAIESLARHLQQSQPETPISTLGDEAARAMYVDEVERKVDLHVEVDEKTSWFVVPIASFGSGDYAGGGGGRGHTIGGGDTHGGGGAAHGTPRRWAGSQGVRRAGSRRRAADPLDPLRGSGSTLTHGHGRPPRPNGQVSGPGAAAPRPFGRSHVRRPRIR